MPTLSKEKIGPFDVSIWRRASIEKRHAMERQRLLTVDKVWKAIETLSHSYIPFTIWDSLDLRVERNTHKLLDLFDESGAGSGKLEQ